MQEKKKENAQFTAMGQCSATQFLISPGSPDTIFQIAAISKVSPLYMTLRFVVSIQCGVLENYLF